jgi:hypothetical protein
MRSAQKVQIVIGVGATVEIVALGVVEAQIDE